MAMEDYKGQSPRNVQGAIGTGRSQLASIRSSNAQALSAKLQEFGSTINRVGQSYANKMAQKEGASDALSVTQKLQGELAGIDAKIQEAYEKGDTETATKLFKQKAEAQIRASAEVYDGGFMRVSEVYNDAANASLLNQFEAQLPVIETQAQILAGDNPQEFNRLYKQYSDTLIKNAPNEKIAQAMSEKIISRGSVKSAQLMLNDYQKELALGLKNQEESNTASEAFINELAASTPTSKEMLSVIKSNKLPSYAGNTKLMGEIGKYTAKLKSQVEAGTLTEGEYNNRVQTMLKKAELATYEATMREAVANTNNISEINAIEEMMNDGGMYRAEKDKIYQALLQQDNATASAEQRQATAQRDFNRKQAYETISYNIDDYTVEQIRSSRMLTPGQKTQLIEYKNKPEIVSHDYIDDNNKLLTMSEEQILALRVPENTKAGYLDYKRKSQAFIDRMGTQQIKEIEDVSKDYYKHILTLSSVNNIGIGGAGGYGTLVEVEGQSKLEAAIPQRELSRVNLMRRAALSDALNKGGSPDQIKASFIKSFADRVEAEKQVRNEVFGEIKSIKQQKADLKTQIAEFDKSLSDVDFTDAKFKQMKQRKMVMLKKMQDLNNQLIKLGVTNVSK